MGIIKRTASKCNCISVARESFGGSHLNMLVDGEERNGVHLLQQMNKTKFI